MSLLHTPDRRSLWLIALAGPAVLAPAWYAVAGGSPLPEPLAGTAGLVLLLLLGTCAITDTCSYKIPNWVTYPALLWALALNAAGQFDPSPTLARALGEVGLGASLCGAAAGFVPLLLLYGSGAAGAGDVKLAATVGALVGPWQALSGLLCAAVVAGTFAAGHALLTAGPLTLARAAGRVALAVVGVAPSPPAPEVGRLLTARLPLGAFLAAGVLLALFLPEGLGHVFAP